MPETINFINQIKNNFNNKILNEDNGENPINEHNLIKRNNMFSSNQYALYKRDDTSNKFTNVSLGNVLSLIGSVLFTIVYKSLANNAVQRLPENQRADALAGYDGILNLVINLAACALVGVKTYISPTAFANIDTGVLLGNGVINSIYQFHNRKICTSGNNSNTPPQVEGNSSTASQNDNESYVAIDMKENQPSTSSEKGKGPSNDDDNNDDNPSTTSQNGNNSGVVNQGNENSNISGLQITDLDITTEGGEYYLSYDDNGITKKIKIKKEGMLQSIINEHNNKSKSGETSSNDNCQSKTPLSSPGKRAVAKSNCNKKQILRDSVFINEKVKNTIKNNIGKLDDIDPDNGYKELMDSVEYSNYLSEAIDNADDFSENSQFGEDADSSISLGDISDRMKKSANTLKNNVETAVSQDMLSTSRKRTIRHSTKQKGNNSGKSISKVVNASSKKKKQISFIIE
jgi:hypothetical protein